MEQVDEMLASINIRLYILRTMAYELPPQEGGIDILWLYNPGEAHYEYFSFHEPLSSDSSPTNIPNFSNNSSANIPNPNLFNRFSNNESNKASVSKTRKRRLGKN